MPQRTPGHSFPTPETQQPKAALAAAADLQPDVVPQAIEGLVETLSDLQKEAVLSALEASIRSKKKGTKMAEPERTLSADDGLTKVKALPDIKARLKKRDMTALDEAKDIRNQVVAKELPKFDDLLEKWLNAKP